MLGDNLLEGKDSAWHLLVLREYLLGRGNSWVNKYKEGEGLKQHLRVSNA